MQNNQRTIMPLQPYLVLQSNTYKRMEDLDLGISHFYEFTLEGKSAFRLFGTRWKY